MFLSKRHGARWISVNEPRIIRHVGIVLHNFASRRRAVFPDMRITAVNGCKILYRAINVHHGDRPRNRTGISGGNQTEVTSILNSGILILSLLTHQDICAAAHLVQSEIASPTRAQGLFWPSRGFCQAATPRSVYSVHSGRHDEVCKAAYLEVGVSVLERSSRGVIQGSISTDWD